MKENLGSALALYPMPVVVVGVMAKEKPTWTLAAHVGIIGHDKVLVSLASNHYINKFIKEEKKLSINMVGDRILARADYVGSVSSNNTDKSEVFEYTKYDKAPIIDDSDLSMECSVVDIYKTKGFESFICSIDNTYVEKDCLNDDMKIDYCKIKPVLFDFPNYEYLSTGEKIGKCLSFKNEYK